MTFLWFADIVNKCLNNGYIHDCLRFITFDVIMKLLKSINHVIWFICTVENNIWIMWCHTWLIFKFKIDELMYKIQLYKIWFILCHLDQKDLSNIGVKSIKIELFFIYICNLILIENFLVMKIYLADRNSNNIIWFMKRIYNNLSKL